MTGFYLRVLYNEVLIIKFFLKKYVNNASNNSNYYTIR